MDEKKHTPGPWRTRVIPAASGFEYTPYAHQVVIGNREFTVAHNDHRNYDKIEKRELSLKEMLATQGLGDGGCATHEYFGVGSRKPDLTPHPDARLIAAAPDLLAACEAGVQTIEQLIPEPSARGVADVVLFQLRAAIRLATGAQP